MPTAPLSVLTPPSAGDPPDAPAAVLDAAVDGDPPTSPLMVLEAAGEADLLGVMVSGISDPSAANGYYPVAGTGSGKSFFQLGIYRLKWTGSEFVLEPDSGLLVYFSSSEDELTPDLVGAWTADVGAGVLVVSAVTVAAPAAVLTAAADGDPPAAALSVLTSTEESGAPDAPVLVLAAAGGGAAPDAPLSVLTAATDLAPPLPPYAVYGITAIYGLYNTNNQILRNTDDAELQGTQG